MFKQQPGALFSRLARSAKPPVARPAFLPKEGPPGLPGAKGARLEKSIGKATGGDGNLEGVEWIFFWLELDEVG